MWTKAQRICERVQVCSRNSPGYRAAQLGLVRPDLERAYCVLRPQERSIVEQAAACDRRHMADSREAAAPVWRRRLSGVVRQAETAVWCAASYPSLSATVVTSVASLLAPSENAKSVVAGSPFCWRTRSPRNTPSCSVRAVQFRLSAHASEGLCFKLKVDANGEYPRVRVEQDRVLRKMGVLLIEWSVGRFPVWRDRVRRTGRCMRPAPHGDSARGSGFRLAPAPERRRSACPRMMVAMSMKTRGICETP